MIKTETFPVEGLMCANCAMHTERALKNMEGVENAVCNFASLEAQVTYDPARVTPNEMAEAVEKAGYKLVVLQQQAGAENNVTENIEEMRAQNFLQAKRRTIWPFSYDSGHDHQYVLRRERPAPRLPALAARHSGGVLRRQAVLHQRVEATPAAHLQHGHARCTIHRHRLSV